MLAWYRCVPKRGSLRLATQAAVRLRKLVTKLGQRDAELAPSTVRLNGFPSASVHLQLGFLQGSLHLDHCFLVFAGPFLRPKSAALGSNRETFGFLLMQKRQAAFETVQQSFLAPKQFWRFRRSTIQRNSEHVRQDRPAMERVNLPFSPYRLRSAQEQK